MERFPLRMKEKSQSSEAEMEQMCMYVLGVRERIERGEVDEDGHRADVLLSFKATWRL